MKYKFKAQTIGGDWVEGYLSQSQGQPHIEDGFYISNSAGAPWAYGVRPETITSELIDENEKLRTLISEIRKLELTWRKAPDPNTKAYLLDIFQLVKELDNNT